MTKKEKRLQEIETFLQNNGFTKNHYENYVKKNNFNENVIFDIKGNNVKVKVKGEKIYSNLISKTSTATLERILRTSFC